ncbi:MAG: hypothetical protein WDN06_22075 [Asticcacaulis sp.]
MTEVMRARMALWWSRAQGLRARPRLMAILCGVLLGFAQPPFGFLPGLFGYALLLWLLEGDLGSKPKRTAFLVAWIAGFFYFLIGCFWVAEAFLVFGRHLWLDGAVCRHPAAGRHRPVLGCLRRALQMAGSQGHEAFPVLCRPVQRF